MPATAGAVDLRDHSAAGKNSERTRHHQARPEYRVTHEHVGTAAPGSGRAKLDGGLRSTISHLRRQDSLPKAGAMTPAPTLSGKMRVQNPIPLAKTAL